MIPTVKSPLLGGLLAAILVLALVVSVASAALTVQQVLRRHDSESTARRDAAALAAGKEAAVAFTSIDYRHVDDDLARVADKATGTFRENFTKALGAMTARIKKSHGVSVGHVEEAGIVRSSARTAVVLAAVDATVTNDALERPSTRRYRFEVTLILIDGVWRTSQITAVA